MTTKEKQDLAYKTVCNELYLVDAINRLKSEKERVQELSKEIQDDKTKVSEKDLIKARNKYNKEDHSLDYTR